MRLSVLLPTRNGGEYLNDAIASVLSIPSPNLELVISDNASDADTRAVIDRFAGDSRLKCLRVENPISVTDNWNRTLDASTGDYAVMIGDDDCVLPNFYDVLAAAVERHRSPDCVTFNGFSYVFPRSVGDLPQAYYTTAHFNFGEDFRPDAELSRPMRDGLVRDMFRFRVRFPLNMQLTMFSRRIAARIPGGCFRPPFPDHWALNSMLLIADRMVYIPDRVVVVGISPKSFGHFYYGGQQRAGAQYLGLETADNGRLPGSELLNCMRDWLLMLKETYPEHLQGIDVSRWNYAGRQVWHWMRDFEFGTLSASELAARVSRLSLPERVMFVLPLLGYRGALRVLRGLGLRDRERFLEMWPSLRPLPGVDSIAEFAAWTRTNQAAMP